MGVDVECEKCENYDFTIINPNTNLTKIIQMKPQHMKVTLRKGTILFSDKLFKPVTI